MNFKGKFEFIQEVVNNNKMPYVNLHCHSYFSLLDGLSSPEQIVAAAKSMGHPAVSITDHASISSLPELFRYSLAVQIKPIIGVEFYIVDSLAREKQRRHHLIVLAKTWEGVRSIFKNLTLANKQTYHRPRLSFEQALEFEDCVISTACSAGFLCRDDYVELHRMFLGKYGKDYVLEVMPHDYPEQRLVNDRAQELSAKDNVMIVATNDAHYISLEDRETHEMLLAIQTRAKWSKEDRFGKNWPNCDFKSRADMIDGFKEVGISCSDTEVWLNNTLLVADKINVVMPEFKVRIASPFEENYG